jgi:hypothetical protein
LNEVRTFTLRVHENAELSCEEFDDRLEFKLVNKITGKISERPYYKLDTGISVGEAVKIDTIIYHMHNEIDLNLWESNNTIN